MSRHKGKPSGINKSNDMGTGVPNNFSPSNQKKDNRQTDKYTNGDERVTEKIRQRHANRNVDKNDATNAGGYRN